MGRPCPHGPGHPQTEPFAHQGTGHQPLAGPFTKFEEAGGPNELCETPRGSGVRHSVGELLTCPFCLSQWIATGFAFGLVTGPRSARVVASVFAALGISDFLQLAYATAQKTAE